MCPPLRDVRISEKQSKMDPIVGIGSNVCRTGACNRADHHSLCTGDIDCPKLTLLSPAALSAREHCPEMRPP